MRFPTVNDNFAYPRRMIFVPRPLTLRAGGQSGYLPQGAVSMNGATFLNCGSPLPLDFSCEGDDLEGEAFACLAFASMVRSVREPCRLPPLANRRMQLIHIGMQGACEQELSIILPMILVCNTGGRNGIHFARKRSGRGNATDVRAGNTLLCLVIVVEAARGSAQLRG